MKRFALTALAAGALALGLGGTAAADVERYPALNGTLTFELSNGYVHTFELTIDPCDGDFWGPGTSFQPGVVPGVDFVTETIEGSLPADGTFNFVASYTGVWEEAFPNYQWFPYQHLPGHLDSIMTGEDNTFPGTFTMIPRLTNLTETQWRNHGAFVSASTNKEAAEASCIGKPIQAAPSSSASRAG